MKDNKGFGKLKNVEDYWGKLCWEYNELKNDSDNIFKAFNFVVTAFHLLEWIEPKKIGQQNHNWTQLKTDIKYLKICEQLANGAKHFEIDNKRHDKVKTLNSESYVEDGYVESGYFEEPIIITLSDSTKLTILQFSDSLMKDWKKELIQRNYKI